MIKEIIVWHKTAMGKTSALSIFVQFELFLIPHDAKSFKHVTQFDSGVLNNGNKKVLRVRGPSKAIFCAEEKAVFS